jgi:hypothetical protein
LQDCNFELRITPQPIENPSTSLPGLLQGLKNPPLQRFGLDV